MQKLSIQNGPWDELKLDAQLIRRSVFIEEQNIAEEDEWDEQDVVSLHFVVYVENQPIATARLLSDHSVGRVAVLKEYRGQNIGLKLMLDIIQMAKTENREFLKLSSQVHATPFYTRLGFTTVGDEYLDCGIQHIEMIQHLKHDCLIKN